MGGKNDSSRFVPTLTEVVQPEAGHSGRPMAEAATRADAHILDAAAPASAIAAQDTLVAELLQRLLPNLSSELQDALRESVDAHMQALLPRLANHIEEAVRAALDRAAQEGKARN
jgi:hypothetical protein